ncbi:Lachesin-like protein [Leptotrombidium deliense]|uniref:Lachesin-like protein n=1 Tax=Leptotrombidium deliense TaxID=299467 RepID=A0A443SWE0_9ACAR|nr:Lachesin-like protein [Leptotrombidium deliense]
MNNGDFGVIHCFARNVAGEQREPCVFELKAAIGTHFATSVFDRPPPPPKDCRLFNESSDSLIVSCRTANSGNAANAANDGEQITYHLQVYDSQRYSVLLALRENEPKFVVNISKLRNANDEEMLTYILHIFASNVYGKSSFVKMNVELKVQLMLNRISNYSSSSGIDYPFEIWLSFRVENNENLLGFKLPLGMISTIISIVTFIFIVIFIKVKKPRMKCCSQTERRKSGQETNSREILAIAESIGNKYSSKEEAKSIPPDIIELNAITLDSIVHFSCEQRFHFACVSIVSKEDDKNIDAANSL